MEESQKHDLEGLLEARVNDIRRGRRPRTRRPLTDVPRERQAPEGDGRTGRRATRRCADCGREIAPRRLVAMPHATRCLDCQRALERARTHS